MVAGFLVESQGGGGGLCVVWGALCRFTTSGGVSKQTGASKQVGCDLRILGDLRAFEVEARSRGATLGVTKAAGLGVKQQSDAVDGGIAFALFVKPSERSASRFFLKCAGFFKMSLGESEFARLFEVQQAEVGAASGKVESAGFFVILFGFVELSEEFVSES